MFKRSAVLLLSLALFSSVLYAQRLQIGIKAGTDMHKISGQAFSDQFTFGYHAGLFAEVGLHSIFSIQPEVYFSETSLDTGTNFRQVYQFKEVPKIKFRYINIPLLLNIRPSKFIALQVGPQYGILISQNISLVNNGKEALTKGDLGLVGGLQFSFSRIRIYGRYVVGLSDLNDIDKNDSWKSQTVHLGFGLKF